MPRRQSGQPALAHLLTTQIQRHVLSKPTFPTATNNKLANRLTDHKFGIFLTPQCLDYPYNETKSILKHGSALSEYRDTFRSLILQCRSLVNGSNLIANDVTFILKDVSNPP
jgi:hypothetical protein